MEHVNRIATAIFDAVFSVMESWPGWASLAVLSALTGVIALVAYKYTSNQKAIGRVHNDIRVALLAAKLYKDNLGVTLRAQGQLFSSATKLFLLSLQPLAVMTIPMVLLLAQMAPRYEWLPLRPGDDVAIFAELSDRAPKDIPDLAIEVPAGVEIVAPPRNYYSDGYKSSDKVFPRENCVYARLRVQAAGRHVVTLRAAQATVQKELQVSANPQARMSPIRPGADFWDQLLYAVEPAAAKDDIIQKIWIEPVRPGVMRICGLELHWIIWWLILSMIFALVVKPFLKVQMW